MFERKKKKWFYLFILHFSKSFSCYRLLGGACFKNSESDVPFFFFHFVLLQNPAFYFFP